MKASVRLWRILVLSAVTSADFAPVWSTPGTGVRPAWSGAAAASAATASRPAAAGGFSAVGCGTAAETAATLHPGLRQLSAASLDIAPPTLAWNGFFGASSEDQTGSVVTDGQGNAYVAGMFCHDPQLGTPIRPFAARCDMLVAKLAPNGELVWHTFLGGRDAEWATGLALASDGDPYVAGLSTQAWRSNPLRPSANAQDGGAHLARLSPEGALRWTRAAGQGVPSALATDQQGDLYLAGEVRRAGEAPCGHSAAIPISSLPG